jgi:hypothetical protein
MLKCRGTQHQYINLQRWRTDPYGTHYILHTNLSFLELNIKSISIYQDRIEMRTNIRKEIILGNDNFEDRDVDDN